MNVFKVKSLTQSIDKLITNPNNKKIIFNSDYEQLSRVFFNLIKNGIETIQEKATKNHDYKGKIYIELYDNSDEILLYR